LVRINCAIKENTTSDHSKVLAHTVMTRASPTSCPQ
jgi:hypothetical protein